jgi:hypothetical protein
VPSVRSTDCSPPRLTLDSVPLRSSDRSRAVSRLSRWLALWAICSSERSVRAMIRFSASCCRRSKLSLISLRCSSIVSLACLTNPSRSRSSARARAASTTASSCSCDKRTALRNRRGRSLDRRASNWRSNFFSCRRRRRASRRCFLDIGCGSSCGWATSGPLVWPSSPSDWGLSAGLVLPLPIFPVALAIGREHHTALVGGIQSEP